MAEMTTYLSNLAQEAADERAPFLQWAELCTTLYLYGEETISGDIVIHEIQTAIIAAVDVQSKEPMRSHLRGRESGEPSVTYWAGPQEMAVNLFGGLDYAAAKAVPGSPVPAPPPPLPDAIAKQLQGDMNIDQSYLEEITDENSVKRMQIVFDAFWDMSGMDKRIRRSLLKTNVAGWNVGMLWFDRQLLKFEILSLSPEQAYLDADYEDLDDMTYAGVDLVLDAEKAVRMFPYPKVMQAIRDYAATGSPSAPAGASGLGRFESKNYHRPMIVVRVFWLRNSQYEVVPEPTAVPTTEPTAEPTEPKYVYGIRQLIEINGEIVDDRKCEYSDIPLLLNGNIPIPDTPFAIGEPYRVMGMSEARNRIVRTEVNHTDYYRNPVTVVSDSIREQMDAQGFDFVS
ncbi:MAG: hypothetical protein ABFE01_02010, partial [Phycisphaerales bacterium]